MTLSETGRVQRSLRDLLVSLIKLGDAEQALEQRATAGAKYREAMELSYEALALGENPLSLLDLALALQKYGETEQAEGRWKVAGPLYQKAAEVSRRVLALHGETPERCVPCRFRWTGSGPPSVGRPPWSSFARPSRSIAACCRWWAGRPSR